jgi:Zn-dependent protease with chaperone function
VVNANYFDGRSTRVRRVTLSLAGDALSVQGEDVDLRVAPAAVSVDERLGSAPRRVRFQDGSFCEVADLAGLDALLASMGHRDGAVDRMQRLWQFALAACALCIALAVLGYKVVLPWASVHAARRLPPSFSRTLSAQTLKALDGTILLPSRLENARRAALTAQYRALRLPEGGTPTGELLLRRSPAVGANAFTLADGTIVLLDELVASIGDDRQIMAVLAHELGHAHGRHGLQLLLRSTAVGAFWTIVAGDVSQLLAAAPAVLIEARYSQDFEREADDYGAALLIHNGLSPGLLADVLEKLTRVHPAAANGGYLASHPPTAERIRRLRALAASHPAET